MNQTIEQMLDRQRAYFASGATKRYETRVENLKKLSRWIHEHEKEICGALYQDLDKAPFECYATEIGIVLEEVRYALKHLREWMKPEHVPTPLTQFPAKCFRVSEPYGVVLVMAPWNYPFQLSLAPLVGAIAAGNCVMLKPSAYAPHTSALLARMIREIYPDTLAAVIEGGREENTRLLSCRFDYIFFTGGVTVGKTVMEAAAKHLTPVTLELGGKSPCIVDETANLRLAARRIVWGKFLNAGQTCVAPDYVLVQSDVRDRLAEALKKEIRRQFGREPLKNRDYPKIINEKHRKRLQGLLEGCDILTGGKVSEADCKIEPTVVAGVHGESPVMQEEIFGPILPVLVYDRIEEAIAFVKRREKPLALYLFTGSTENEKKVLSNLSYGGGCVNDTVVHLATPYMPFGGVGNSGMGSYHGKESFNTFSHKKSIMKKALWLDIPLRYAPYRRISLSVLKKIQK
ncbi:MAG: aldehyde dehydrogenase [Eubacteriales bacterium]|nr:aldehyde dehydrogenase [Eubacteriales bacterium]